MNINNILKCVTYRVILYSVPDTSETAIFWSAVVLRITPLTPSGTEIPATISAASWF